ncbi:hypothetical protein E2C01_001415 [Portunus trituberculatus]|uniref:Uncharacterized protein n=1 Tax=Portunus trituberculatus TaxID=210409 RepID=A0A5B7CJ80_PORTR|nr:hypothetical protein [Portunus trituberculatus]
MLALRFPEGSMSPNMTGYASDGDTCWVPTKVAPNLQKNTTAWWLNGGEVDCVGHLEVVAQPLVEHELAAFKHHWEHIWGGHNKDFINTHSTPTHHAALLPHPPHCLAPVSATPTTSNNWYRDTFEQDPESRTTRLTNS